MKSVSETKKQIILGGLAILTVLGGIMASERVNAQDPNADQIIVDKLAAKTSEKFNGMSCKQLASAMSPEAAKTKDPEKAKITAKFIGVLKQKPELKTRFLNQVSAPIVTKMFDCGFIPKS